MCQQGYTTLSLCNPGYHPPVEVKDLGLGVEDAFRTRGETLSGMTPEEFDS